MRHRLPGGVRPQLPARHVSAEEEGAILARADELNARIEGVLAETR